MAIIKKKGVEAKIITGPADTFEVIRSIFKREQKIDRNKEHFWTIALNMAKKILCIELVGLGSFRNVACSPADVFSIPLQKKASKLILVHNHPSGNLSPSPEDLDVTDRLMQVGNIHSCIIIDHLIIGEHKRDYYSFADDNLLKEIERNSRYYIPPLGYQEAQKKEVEDLLIRSEKEKEKSKKQGIEEGVALAIEKLVASGMSREEAEKLLRDENQ